MRLDVLPSILHSLQNLSCVGKLMKDFAICRNERAAESTVNASRRSYIKGRRGEEAGLVDRCENRDLEVHNKYSELGGRGCVLRMWSGSVERTKCRFGLCHSLSLSLSLVLSCAI